MGSSGSKGRSSTTFESRDHVLSGESGKHVLHLCVYMCGGKITVYSLVSGLGKIIICSPDNLSLGPFSPPVIKLYCNHSLQSGLQVFSCSNEINSSVQTLARPGDNYKSNEGLNKRGVSLFEC